MRRETHTRFQYKNMQERAQFEDLDMDGRISKWMLHKYSERMRTALICIRLGICGRLLSTC
jgi:DNA transposition AAA+ family ATPase